jgi:hypothetical protein
MAGRSETGICFMVFLLTHATFYFYILGGGGGVIYRQVGMD